MEEENLPNKLPHICIGKVMGVCGSSHCSHNKPHRKNLNCDGGRCKYYNKYMRDPDTNMAHYVDKYDFKCVPMTDEIQHRTTKNNR